MQFPNVIICENNFFAGKCMRFRCILLAHLSQGRYNKWCMQSSGIYRLDWWFMDSRTFNSLIKNFRLYIHNVVVQSKFSTERVLKTPFRITQKTDQNVQFSITSNNKHRVLIMREKLLKQQVKSLKGSLFLKYIG